jgi:hypothetical protein
MMQTANERADKFAMQRSPGYLMAAVQLGLQTAGCHVGG